MGESLIAPALLRDRTLAYWLAGMESQPASSLANRAPGA